MSETPNARMQPLLVFGAAGQIGHELIDLLREREIPAIGLTRQDVDIASDAAVARCVRQVEPSLIINAAAYTAVDKAEREADLAFAVNATGAAHVARAAAAHDVTLIHISTDYVFDGTKNGTYVETDAIHPLSNYGQSKAAGEDAVREHAPKHVILRTSWVYGRHGANFLKTMLRLGATRDILRVVDDQHGCPTAARDIAEALLAVAHREAASSSAYGTFHFAGPDAMSWYAFADLIFEVQADRTGRRVSLQPITTADYPTPAVRPRNSVLDSRAFAKTFGYTAANCRQRVEEIVDALDESIARDI